MQTQEDYVAFSGDPDKAFDTALQTLLPLGFEVELQSSSRLVVTGPGFNSTRQNALLGVSRAEFSAEHHALRVSAQLGGVERIRRSLIILLVSLGVFDSLVFLALWYFLDSLRVHPWFLAIPALTLIPWVVIGPVISRLIGSRTRAALNTLLHNMAILS